MASASAAVAGSVPVHMSWLTSPGRSGCCFLIRHYPEGLTFSAALRPYSITFLESF
jgi:hypothetical protein